MNRESIYYSDLVDTIFVKPGEVINLHSPLVAVVPPYFNIVPFIETSNDLELINNSNRLEEDGTSNTKIFKLKVDVDLVKASILVGCRDLHTNKIFEELSKEIRVFRK